MIVIRIKGQIIKHPVTEVEWHKSLEEGVSLIWIEKLTKIGY